MAVHIPARREARPRRADCIAYGAERPGGRFFRSTEDEADIGMSNEPTRSVQDEGEAGLSHLDRRNHIPNQLEIDFGDNRADRWSITDNRNRQVWFGASMVAYIAKPDLCRAGADYCGISGSVCAAFNSIEADPRDIEALQAAIVEECQTDDGGACRNKRNASVRRCSSGSSLQGTWTNQPSWFVIP